MVDYFYHFDYLSTVAIPQPIAEATAPVTDSEPEEDAWPTSSRKSESKKERRIRLARAQAQAASQASEQESPGLGPTPATNSTSTTSQPPVNIIEHAKVFAIAVKYQVDGLRDLAAEKFKRSAKVFWDHEDFAHAIFVVHNSTSDGVSKLRDIVADTLCEHFDKLKHKPEIETVVCSIPALAYALLKRGGTATGCPNGHNAGLYVYKCPYQGCNFKQNLCDTCRTSGRATCLKLI
jgi:high-affinity K+ transport system ATPase subunit B